MKNQALPPFFYVRTPTVELYTLVQKKLFELGHNWCYGSKEVNEIPNYGENHCIGIFEKKGLTYSSWDCYHKDFKYVEISIADLFLISSNKTKEIYGYQVTVSPETVKISDSTDWVELTRADFNELVKFVNE